MIGKMFGRDDLGESKRQHQLHYSEEQVVELVSRLGEAAVDEFQAGLRDYPTGPDKKTARDRAKYLHDSAVSALALLAMGGLDGLKEAEVRASQAPVKSADEVIEAVEQLGT